MSRFYILQIFKSDLIFNSLYDLQALSIVISNNRARNKAWAEMHDSQNKVSQIIVHFNKTIELFSTKPNAYFLWHTIKIKLEKWRL